MRTVALLGAGSTRGAFTGITRRRIHPPLNNDFFVQAGKFTALDAGSRHRTGLDRLQRFIEQSMRETRRQPPTMETVFNSLFIAKDLPEVYRRSGPLPPPGFRREIGDFLSLVVGLLRFVQSNPRHPAGTDHHLSLARALQDGDTIVSLNYDTLMDNSLLQVGWDPSFGYGFRPPRVEYSDVPRPPRRPREVLLLKPHGSLNWSADGSRRHLEQVLSQGSPSRILMAPVPRAYDRRATIRFFVPPLYSKFLANELWRTLWNAVFGRLREAEHLLIIGCSIIESDFHLRTILGHALIRRPERFRAVTIVEPDPEVRERLRQMLRATHNRSIEWHQTFTDYVEARLTYRPGY